MCPRMALVCFVSRSKTDYKSVSMFLGKQRLLRSALAERISMFFCLFFFLKMHSLRSMRISKFSEKDMILVFPVTACLF